MLERAVIVIVGAGFAVYCVVFAFLTLFGKNPATLHLTKFYQIGYAAINAVLTPFGISGVIGGISRKKTLIRAFVQFQWLLATFILIGLHVFNVILSKNGKGDFIRRCQSNLAKGQSESDFLNRCTAIVDDAERATFIAACAQGGIMLFLAVILLIVGTREYKTIRLEEETKTLLEKANFNENKEMDELERLSKTSLNPTTNNSNNNGSDYGDTFVPDSYDLRRYSPPSIKNVKRQPTVQVKATTTNVELTRRPTNANTINATQYSGLRRHPTDPSTMSSQAALGRNQPETNFVPQSYEGLARNPTNPGNIPQKRLARYPTNRSTNVTRQPTIGNAYAYVVTPQEAFPVQRSLSTRHYINPPPPSYVPRLIIPPPQQTLVNIAPITEVDEYYDYDYSNDYNNYDYVPPTKTMPLHLTRMGMH